MISAPLATARLYLRLNPDQEENLALRKLLDSRGWLVVRLLHTWNRPLSFGGWLAALDPDETSKAITVGVRYSATAVIGTSIRQRLQCA